MFGFRVDSSETSEVAQIMKFPSTSYKEIKFTLTEAVTSYGLKIFEDPFLRKSFKSEQSSYRFVAKIVEVVVIVYSFSNLMYYCGLCIHSLGHSVKNDKFEIKEIWLLSLLREVSTFTVEIHKILFLCSVLKKDNFLCTHMYSWLFKFIFIYYFSPKNL